MAEKPTFQETVLDAGRTRIIRTGEDGTVEDLTEAPESEPGKTRNRRAAAPAEGKEA